MDTTTSQKPSCSVDRLDPNLLFTSPLTLETSLELTTQPSVPNQLPYQCRND